MCIVEVNLAFFIFSFDLLGIGGQFYTMKWVKYTMKFGQHLYKLLSESTILHSGQNLQTYKNNLIVNKIGWE
jgi:hypothetical protein